MYLTETCIKKPVFTTVLSLIIIAVGAIFFTKLELRDTPNISPPLITVSAIYQGADAGYMEREITQKIEQELKSTKNMESMISTSSIGKSEITIVLGLDSDIEVALSDVRSKISGLSQSLPDDMQLPSVEKLDIDARPSIWLTVNSDIYDDLELTRISDNQIKSVLEKLPTVGSALIFGARYYSMLVEPINKKLVQHKISPFEIESAIRAQNQDYPAGIVKTDALNFSIKLSGVLNTVEEFENIIIKKNADGGIVKLSDIANVSLQPVESDVYLRYNGKPSLAIGLVKQSTANVITLADSVRESLPQITKNLPSGINVTIAYDAAVPVNASINAVYITIIEAIFLVGLVTYLFLGSAQITLIPLVTIPISLIGTFFAMYLLGFSINTFTLLAMILAIGLVVDDAIVMMENIYRHIHDLKKSPIEGAMDGASEIGFAVVAMTITLASVFFPVGFVDGMLGRLFIEFAWTLAFCILISGFVALTLTPMMSGRMMQKTIEVKRNFILILFERFINYLQLLYLKVLKYITHNRKIFVITCLSTVLLLIFGFAQVKKTFVPEEDQGFLLLLFKGPEGSNAKTSLSTIIEAEKILATIPEIYGYFDLVGHNGGDEGVAFIPMKNWKDRTRLQEQVQMEINQRVSELPGMSIFAIAPPSIGGRRGDKEIEFYITSTMEYEDLDLITEKFLQEMKKSSILADSEREFKASTPTLDIIIDRERAYRYGVGLDVIGGTIQYLIAGKTTGDFRIGADIYDVILKYNIENRNNVDDIKKIFIKNNHGQMLPIGTVADIIETITIKEYNHYNTSRAIKLTANLAQGKTLENAVIVIEDIAKRILGDGKFQLEYDGQIKQMQESSGDTILIFIFALLFIFLVLAAQFESFGDSLLILVAVPFSMVGGVFALLLFNDSLNMYSNIGLITLIGLVTKNSIMIVEFANQLRLQGHKIYDAIMKAAALRFRPIIMTSIATMCGAMPLLFASGAGAAARGSIGLVIVGGMMVGTLFTIFVIPVLYHAVKKDN